MVSFSVVRFEWCVKAEKNCLPLSFDKGRKIAPAALAQLAFAQRVRQALQPGNGIDGEPFEFCVGSENAQRALPHQAHAQRLIQLEMVDAKQFQRLLHFGQTPRSRMIRCVVTV